MLLHPSPEIRFPSSQPSSEATMSSPQVEKQTDGLFLVQLNPVSIVHVLEHPSPEIRFPSSHSSGEITIPSPQTEWQGPPI